MSKLLTEKQENFARLVSNGEQLTSAYRKVYDVKDTTKEKSVWEQASALASSSRSHQGFLNCVGKMKRIIARGRSEEVSMF